jgi:hypothetical protein
VPEAKLIAILRNPIDRAYSAYLHLIRDSRETVTDFGEALRREQARIADRWEHIWHYKHMGLYHEQLTRYYDAFDLDNIKVYLYHDFRTDPLGVLRDVFRFLGVDEAFVPDISARHNASSLPPDRTPPLPLDVRMELHRAFREDILKLQDLLGRDLSCWTGMPSGMAGPECRLRSPRVLTPTSPPSRGRRAEMARCGDEGSRAGGDWAAVDDGPRMGHR